VTLRPEDVVRDSLDQPFWDACCAHRFLLHVCATCGRAYWPASTCIDHGASAMEWRDSAGRGAVHTYTIVHHAYDAALADRVPYVLVVVQLDEGPFFHTDIVGAEVDDVHVGMRVGVVYDAIDERTVLPRFSPLTEHPPPIEEDHR
jgi:uncharacterized protein